MADPDRQARVEAAVVRLAARLAEDVEDDPDILLQALAHLIAGGMYALATDEADYMLGVRTFAQLFRRQWAALVEADRQSIH